MREFGMMLTIVTQTIRTVLVAATVVIVAAVAAGSVPAAQADLRAQADAIMSKAYPAFIALKNNKTTRPAQFDWSSDGCSPSWTPSFAYRNLFSSPCQMHDFGYRNYGNGLRLGRDEQTRSWIDDRFEAEMVRLCNSTFTRWWQKANKVACVLEAGTMWAVVRGHFGRTAFYGPAVPTAPAPPPAPTPAPTPAFNPAAYNGHIVKQNNGSAASWLVIDAAGHRNYIPTGAIYNCLVAAGHPGPDLLSAAQLDQLPDQNGVWASCTTPTAPPPVVSPSVSVSDNGGQMAVQLSNFPLGTTYFFCHAGSGYPTGGSITNHGQFNVTSPNQSFSSGLCSGSGNFWIGLQATDHNDYYSNQVTLVSPPPPVVAPSVSVSDNGGQMAVQLSNFPLGTTYFFCHAGSGYPTGGSITNHGQFDVTSPNQSFSSGLCSGSGNFWIGLQATDHNDYYSNQVTLVPPPPPVAVPAPTYAETTGGAANTWTNYTNAGGSQGPTIPGFTTVQIACKTGGFRVADGNTWWYRIASSPWNNQYFVSADAFYNNGATSGSLHGTPYVDPAVPDC